MEENSLDVINKYTLAKELAEEFAVSEARMRKILQSYYKRRMYYLLKGHPLWTVGGRISIGEKTRRKVYVPTLGKTMNVEGKKIKFLASRHLYKMLNEGKKPIEIE